MKHVPVLMNEVLDGLNLQSGDTVIDATVGLGGHAQRLLDVVSPGGELIGFDRDERNLQEAKRRLGSDSASCRLIHDSFANVGSHDLPGVDGALFDLGYSSVHVDDAERGFSFQQDGPLDMRYDTRDGRTAEDIVNDWSEEELARIFRQFGEERFSARIAQRVVRERKMVRITTTTQLADVVASAVPARGKIHPATKVFQALRMEVNDELSHIEKGLGDAIGLLKSGGRIAVISFHSLEDRLVKQLFKGRDDLGLINKKVIRPSDEETSENPRARSAKLRVAEKI